MGIINNLINTLKDNFTMAEFNINGRMTVSSLRKQFKDAFGATLRVYKGPKFAPENATLASIRSGENVKGGELTCRGNLQVANFEAKMKDIFGITVKVANPDNTKLVRGNMTIAAAGREVVETDNLNDEQLGRTARPTYRQRVRNREERLLRRSCRLWQEHPIQALRCDIQHLPHKEPQEVRDILHHHEGEILLRYPIQQRPRNGTRSGSRTDGG